jgi:protein-disulfide isomerase
MPSRKQKRKRRDTAPARGPAPAAAPRRERRASPRVLLVAGIVLGVAAVAVVLGLVLTGGSKKSIPSDALPGTKEVEALLAGIPQNGSVLGSPSAPVKVIEYADLQCPYCADAESHTVSTVISRYVRTGKASLELRLLAGLGADSQRGRLAALAAGFQDKQFDFAALLYRNQGTENSGWLDEAMVQRAAKSIPGLDADKLAIDMGTQDIASKADTNDLEMQRQNVQQTPTFYIDTKNGKSVPVVLGSSVDDTTLPNAIEAALR